MIERGRERQRYRGGSAGGARDRGASRGDFECVDSRTIGRLEKPTRFRWVALIVENDEKCPELLGAAGLVRGIRFSPDVVARRPASVGVCERRAAVLVAHLLTAQAGH